MKVWSLGSIGATPFWESPTSSQQGTIGLLAHLAAALAGRLSGAAAVCTLRGKATV